MFSALFNKVEEVISDTNVSEMKLQEYEGWISIFLIKYHRNDSTSKRAKAILKKIKSIRENRKKKITKDVLSFFS